METFVIVSTSGHYFVQSCKQVKTQSGVRAGSHWSEKTEKCPYVKFKIANASNREFYWITGRKSRTRIKAVQGKQKGPHQATTFKPRAFWLWGDSDELVLFYYFMMISFTNHTWSCPLLRSLVTKVALLQQIQTFVPNRHIFIFLVNKLLCLSLTAAGSHFTTTGPNKESLPGSKVRQLSGLSSIHTVAVL